MALIDWRPLSEMPGIAVHEIDRASKGRGVSSQRVKQRVAQWVATCAMGAWVLLAIVPVVVVIMAIES
ncbi:hypothetical protein ACLRDC_08690 [Gluconacetobacter sacchari]|uniref:Uncharacterized protein n=2 Tax=Gluconacetobacter sacchari TaxID=92759 RepID=A0A7W4I9U9_9PROT|nr:hypothetical protein [Gluconacetobacter sacchari]MBB2158934.1 hypothetical protein [Gluconacetobacter sacchari]GBQ31244.1 hypothetical protein AA12717_3695 [Gluconacetobacter sacchari DSM 12717]